MPDRWDPKSPLYLTPDGEKRNPFSFYTFTGGKRICIGKVFAEMNMKILFTYMSQFFDFEFKDKEKYLKRYPYVVTFIGKTIPVEVELKLREGV